MLPGSKPPCFMLAMTSGDSSARSVAALSFSFTLAGVPVGTDQIDHEVTTRSGDTISAKVGVSGVTGERLAPVEAIGFSLPPLTWPISESMLEMTIGTWPASTSAAAAAAPR